MGEAWQRRDWPAVLALLDSLSTIAPQSVDIQDKRYVAHLSAGQDFLSRGDWPMAVQEWKRAEQVDPGRVEAPRALQALTPTPAPAPPKPLPRPAPPVAPPPASVQAPPAQQLAPVCQQYLNDLRQQVDFDTRAQDLKDRMTRAYLQQDMDTFNALREEAVQIAISQDHRDLAIRTGTDRQAAFVAGCPGIHA